MSNPGNRFPEGAVWIEAASCPQTRAVSLRNGRAVAWWVGPLASHEMPPCEEREAAIGAALRCLAETLRTGTLQAPP